MIRRMLCNVEQAIGDQITCLTANRESGSGYSVGMKKGWRGFALTALSRSPTHT